MIKYSKSGWVNPTHVTHARVQAGELRFCLQGFSGNEYIAVEPEYLADFCFAINVKHNEVVSQLGADDV